MQRRTETDCGRWLACTALVFGMLLAGGCAQLGAMNPFASKFEPAPRQSDTAEDWIYRVGPGDSLQIFVWRHEDLSTSVVVRPDGRFSTALIKEHIATGKTPPELAVEIEELLSEYVRDPLVTVFVGGFVGEYYDQVRVVGEATSPTSIPYRRGMTALDMLIQVGGLTEFAAGNKTVLVRYSEGGEREYNLRLDDLIRDGDISANVAMQPGDILIIPEAWF
jgi:polysaccharide biosynthesis/export protein